MPRLDYETGTEGQVTTSDRILGFTCVAGNDGATVKLNQHGGRGAPEIEGQEISLDAGESFSWEFPREEDVVVERATLIFEGTTKYHVEVVR